MSAEIINIQDSFNKPRLSRPLSAALNAVAKGEREQHLEDRLACLISTVREMRAMQKKRETDLSIITWDIASVMEKQVDIMIGSLTWK